MAETPCILGQRQPDAELLIDLFVVPPEAQVQCSIFIANQVDQFENITIALAPNGTGVATYNYIAYETPLSPNACIAFAGIFLNSGDQVFVSSKFGNCSFTATGMLMA